MYNYSHIARFAACVATTATLIACDSATVTAERSIGLLSDGESINSCAPVVVDLSGTRLLGHASATESTSTVEVAIPDGKYEIHLYYEDELHADPDQADQLDEIWYLEGFNAAGEYALITNHTKDLPKDETSGLTNVGPYDLVGIVAVSGRHASVSPDYDSIVRQYNSIEPTKAMFYPYAGGCLDADPLSLDPA